MTESLTQHREYWQAQGLIHETLSKFDAARASDNLRRQRSAFYRLAKYHGRTLNIFKSALERGNDDLAQSALYNLMALHRGLAYMHRANPDHLPIPAVLPGTERQAFLRDLIIRVLAGSRQDLSIGQITGRVTHLDMLGDVEEQETAGYLTELIREGYVTEQGTGYKRSGRPYTQIDWNVLSLRALVGDDYYTTMADAGYSTLSQIDNRSQSFVTQFPSLTGLTDSQTARVFVETVHTILTTNTEINVWHSADLVHSPYPRPYQRAAFTTFQHGGYQGQVVEAPTGSGKTFIGMMCIQEWLRILNPGQSILVVVPTSNYLQQWTGELCYKEIGLQISAEVVFAGSPMKLYEHVTRTGAQPAIVLTTYTALAQFGSPSGKGGFDAASIEMYLQGANVKYVILDEVHKAVEDPHSVSFDVTNLFMTWLRDGLLNGVIGFSGTAVAYRRRFEQLGMSLDYVIPIDDLVAAGFVAPFGEFGLPFAYSHREKQIREYLDEYKQLLRDYFTLLGPDTLRKMFADLPVDARQHIAHEIVGMYRGRRDWADALKKRFTKWETGRDDALSLNELNLITILQIANKWSDTAMVAALGADSEQFEILRERFDNIRKALRNLIYQPKTLRRLSAEEFAVGLASDALQALPETTSAASRTEASKDLLSTTIAGLYNALGDWYLRMGEGRVETIKAIVNAEMQSRSVTGKIVFDTAKRIRWKDGVATPGYRGVGGLFAEMLGDARFTVIAVLSGEIYLSYSKTEPITERIAQFIETNVIAGYASEAIFGLIVQGVDLPQDKVTDLHDRFEQLMQDYIPTLRNIGASRLGEFHKRIIKPIRRTIEKMDFGPENQQLLLDRLHRRNPNLQTLEQTFFDYALLARAFRDAHVAELEQISGAQQKFFVVPMSSNSHRKQLMYDLTARIVDADELPVNFVIVSTWARTGWNVIKPNLLIDATATRDVTAWQQLVGRAIRARRTWTNDCYRLLTMLTGHQLIPEGSDGTFHEDGHELDEAARSLLQEVAPRDLKKLVANGNLLQLSDKQRERLALELAQHRNKVTHIYELVKAYGSGIQLQYDRNANTWQRRESIAAKHAQEISPNPLTGEKLQGAAHAPFIYVDDPRTDTPESLQTTLEKQLSGSDDNIIRGWLGQ